MANLQSGTRIYGTANVDSQIYVGANVSIGTDSISVSTRFIANTTQLTISTTPLSANGGTGTAGQVLTSNGSIGAPYWANTASSVTTAKVFTYSIIFGRG
jgi:hypothetical protein